LAPPSWRLPVLADCVYLPLTPQTSFSGPIHVKQTSMLSFAPFHPTVGFARRYDPWNASPYVLATDVATVLSLSGHGEAMALVCKVTQLRASSWVAYCAWVLLFILIHFFLRRKTLQGKTMQRQTSPKQVTHRGKTPADHQAWSSYLLGEERPGRGTGQYVRQTVNSATVRHTWQSTRQT
jgi:hypothetical protein